MTNLNSLNIALVTSSFLPSLGGAEIGVHNIALHLIEKGHKPVVITSASVVVALKRSGISFPYKVVSFPPKIWWLFYNFPSVASRILNLFFTIQKKRFSIDVWHVTFGYPTGISMILFAENNANNPYIIRCVGEDIQKDRKIGYGMRLDPKIDEIVSNIMPRAKRVVATTDSILQEYKNLGIDERKITFIPNGVDVRRFNENINRNEVRKTLGISDDISLFISVGRNHPKKNFKGLLNAVSILKKKRVSNFKVMFVGQGCCDLSDYASLLDVADHVILESVVGLEKDQNLMPKFPSDHLVKLYQSADIFVLPSLVESFGIVLIEAMAAGLPVITTNGPGCRDIIREGRDGIMVQTDSDNELADAMERFIKDKSLYKKYQSLSISRANDFSYDNVVDKYLELYHGEIRRYG